MTTRQAPRLSEVKANLRLRRPIMNPTERRLATAHSIGDLRAIARRVTPRPVFDYVDGAAEAEISLRRARTLFRDLEFTPSILRDVSVTDLRSSPLGMTSALPFSFAPTGFTRMMHHEGEPAVARVAERAGIAYALSTMGTSTIEDVAAAAPKARKWFQLYVWRDRDAAGELVRRAAESGYEALILTVDVPVAGARLRDNRNGLTIPPSLSPQALLQMAVHPVWWANLLTTRPLEFASLRSSDGIVSELIDQLLDPTMTIADVDWLRSIWSGPLVIKGIQSVADARRVVDAGADAIVVSNHGGRQLDRAPVPLRLLPEVVAAVGDHSEVWVDTGVTNGADIVACHALGAANVLVGRAYLYGLMAGGERGVQRAVDILVGDVTRTLKLLGVQSIAELHAGHVRLPQ